MKEFDKLYIMCLYCNYYVEHSVLEYLDNKDKTKLRIKCPDCKRIHKFIM